MFFPLKKEVGERTLSQRYVSHPSALQCASEALTWSPGIKRGHLAFCPVLPTSYQNPCSSMSIYRLPLPPALFPSPTITERLFSLDMDQHFPSSLCRRATPSPSTSTTWERKGRQYHPQTNASPCPSPSFLLLHLLSIIDIPNFLFLLSIHSSHKY